MKIFGWLTNGLDSAIAAMSTAPPEQWADGRVIGVAATTFLLGVLRSGREQRTKAKKDEIVAEIGERLELLKTVVQVDGETFNKVRKEIAGKLADAAERIQACERQVDRLEWGQDNLSKRLAGLEELIKGLEKVPDELRGLVRSYRRELEAESGYKVVLKEELGSIKMLGSPDVPNVPVDLLDTFVSLDITAMSAGKYREGLEPNEMRGGADSKLSPESALKRAFEDYRMLLILGDPGCGKTTLVKYYAMLCLKNRHKRLGLDEAALPIYLPLREVESKNGELCPLHECLANWATRHYHPISADTFLAWLHSRQTLILLDGLDEISDLKRRKDICNWIDNAATGLTKARFVVTSRWTGYRKADGIELEFDHAKADVRDFSAEQQKEFLEKWFVAAYQREPRGEGVPKRQWHKQQKQKGLDRARAIVDFLAEKGNKGIRELAVVPMLLQVIAILWRERENLPQGRADLYQAALKYLLDFRDRHKKIEPLMPATQALRVLCPASFWMQDQLHADEVQKNKLHGKMEEKLANMKDSVPAEEFCENLRDRAGLVADYGKEAYIFRHKSFREYLAGLELVTQARETPACLERIVGQFGEDWWNEPLSFFMCEVNDKLFDKFMGALFKSDASKELNPKSHDLLLTMVSEAPERKIDSLVERLNDADSTENQRRYIVDCLKTIGSKPALEAIKEFGEKEAETIAGSVAKEVIATEFLSVQDAAKLEIFDKWFRNPLEFNAEYIHIPSGSFTYSVTKKNELVSDIYFAKYPVTNKRYRRFINYLAGEEEDLSEILAVEIFSSWMFKFATTIGRFSGYLGTDFGKWAENLRSENDDDKRFKGDDQPVVGVSWFAAQAYCRWLSLLDAASKGVSVDESAEKYRLPTELEWEWAASGGERRYPWGDMEPNDKLANYDNNVGATTAVGRYPEGGTPEGLMDMAGNVWEWMEDWYEGYEGKYRSLRGGSWYLNENALRCSYRVYYSPGNRNLNVGFRVVRSQS